MIDDPENVEKLKVNCGSVNTFKDHVKVILIYFKALPSLKESHHESYRAWVDAMAIEKKRVVKESRSNAPSNLRQSANWVTMDEWREALGKLRKEKDPHATLKSSMTLVWVNYVCAIPTKRSDFGAMRIFEAEPSEADCTAHPNHLVLGISEPRMEIGEFKTSKNRDPIVEVLPPDLLKTIKDSIEAHPRQYLFENTKGQPFTRECFSTWTLNRSRELHDGKEAGANLIRHAFITCDVDFNKTALAQLDNIAERMGHSPAQQAIYKYVTMQPNHEYLRSKVVVKKK